MALCASAALLASASFSLLAISSWFFSLIFTSSKVLLILSMSTTSTWDSSKAFPDEMIF